MVVLTIIGLLASVVVLSMPDPRASLVDGGEAFAARARAAQQLAVTETRDIGMWVSAAGYGFERYDGEAWLPMTAAPLQPRGWPEGAAIAVAQQSNVRAGEEARTRIVFDATGLNDPLEVTLSREGKAIDVVIGADGTIRVGGAADG